MVFRDHYRDRLKLADRIVREGFLVDPACDRCARMSETKAVECKRLAANEKCSNCVRAGRRCGQEFYSDKKWERLDKAREKVNIGLAVADDELSCLQEGALRMQKESSKRQEEFLREFLRIQEDMSSLQRSISQILAKHSRLRRHKKQLDEQNMKMLHHDLEILEELDEQNPPPSPPLEEMDFPSSEDFSPSQLLDQMSPDFWARLGIAAVADDNSEVVAGNLLGCQ
jgi:hypothetical protein